MHPIISETAYQYHIEQNGYYVATMPYLEWRKSTASCQSVITRAYATQQHEQYGSQISKQAIADTVKRLAM